MNYLYNAQDVILLCKIFKNRFQMMHDKFYLNPRKCNSVSTLSGCVQRNKSKAIIALPTSNNHVEISEKSFAGGFSCVNSSLAFDSEILMPNNSTGDCISVKFNEDNGFKL